jgi:hypothetical protein
MTNEQLDRPRLAPLRLISIAWGDAFVDDYLNCCLPAALAAGNLPALLPHFSCEIVLVTESRQFERIRQHPAYAAADRLCPVRLVSLDDLVVSREMYGIAISYAFFRGFEDLGPRMTEYVLVFLHADFIAADGSLAALLAHLQRGERLIFAPSYCAVAESVKPLLAARRLAANGVLSIPPRAMATMILQHRHNTIRAKTINQRFLRLPYMEQFYWAVNESVLLGHQLPIALVAMKPERSMEALNSLWDYGVLAEFCPSMKFTVMADSDECLLMELRDRDTARYELRIGWWKGVEAMVEATAPIITDYTHRLGQVPLTLHSKDLPPDIEAHRRQFAAFVKDFYARLPRQLPSHRNHRQWNIHYRNFHRARERFVTRDEPPRFARPGGDAQNVTLDAAGVAEFETVSRQLLEQCGLHERPEAVELLEGVTRRLRASATERPNGPAGVQHHEHRRAAIGHAIRTMAHRLYDRLDQENVAAASRFGQAYERAAERHRELLRLMFGAAQGIEAWAGQESLPVSQSLAARLSRNLFGSAPSYRLWHWNHARTRLAISLAQQAVGTSTRVLYLHRTRVLADVVARAPTCVEAPLWGALRADDFHAQLGKEPRFDCCVIEADFAEWSRFRCIYDTVRPVIIAPGRLLVFFFNNANIAYAPVTQNPELIRDAFPSCGPARVAYTGSWASSMAVATREGVVESMKALIGFSPAYALALATSAPFALAASLIERHRTMENSQQPGKWLSCMAYDIAIG